MTQAQGTTLINTMNSILTFLQNGAQLQCLMRWLMGAVIVLVGVLFVLVMKEVRSVR